MKQIPFVKPFMPVEHQAKLLRLRGLQGPEETIVSRLISVGYYRLSAYWFPFREVEPDGSRNDSAGPGYRQGLFPLQVLGTLPVHQMVRPAGVHGQRQPAFVR